MHLRVRPLQALIELLLLVVGQDLADLLVGLFALGPHLGQALFARQTFVLHELLLDVMQFLEDWGDSGLLIAGEIDSSVSTFNIYPTIGASSCPALGPWWSLSVTPGRGAVCCAGAVSATINMVPIVRTRNE